VKAADQKALQGEEAYGQTKEREDRRIPQGSEDVRARGWRPQAIERQPEDRKEGHTQEGRSKDRCPEERGPEERGPEEHGPEEHGAQERRSWPDGAEERRSKAGEPEAINQRRKQKVDRDGHPRKGGWSCGFGGKQPGREKRRADTKVGPAIGPAFAPFDSLVTGSGS
jgi:hypothetical protein